nr:immunoglobulin light chain junction region [Macaca mulatta]MOW00940.1 immunoglobulin light chain junction region [Macaca mulatta]
DYYCVIWHSGSSVFF